MSANPRQASIFDRVRVRHVKLTRRTGPAHLVGDTRTMPSLAAATAVLFGWAFRVQKRTKDIIEYEICWSDGRIFRGRLALSPAAVVIPDLAAHLEAELNLLAGNDPSEQLDPECLNAIAATYDMSVQDWARELIERYEIRR